LSVEKYENLTFMVGIAKERGKSGREGREEWEAE
jgi:hypothetical protein